MLGAELSDLLSGLSQAIHNVDYGQRIPMASPGGLGSGISLYTGTAHSPRQVLSAVLQRQNL
jgi:hypothetical protein